ncbi:hypothetical protein jhhlp_006777 [Lomentospora prolificans]|uniref:SET domain-containing protein n=1 Tax=Lomentospora prolificans TaxID=41688 RepID=A0A2N3N2Q5_9PEZI|nr:hypothetical protein jhhlp_006777 [Lomentospora prolificans]
MEIFALRDIKPGEELTYSYVDGLQEFPYKDRHKLLGSQFHFECTCRICSDTAARRESNRRRENIKNAKAALSETGDDAAKVVALCKKLLRLYKDEGMVLPRPMTAEIAAYASNQIGEPAEAVKYAKISREYWSIIAGPNSTEVKRLDELIAAPKDHGSYKPKPGKAEESQGAGSNPSGDEEIDDDDDEAVMDAVRSAMLRARKIAKESGVGEQEEEKLVEKAVQAALKRAMSRDEL